MVMDLSGLSARRKLRGCSIIVLRARVILQLLSSILSVGSSVTGSWVGSKHQAMTLLHFSTGTIDSTCEQDSMVISNAFEPQLVDGSNG